MAIINKTGIADGGLIEAEHVTRIIDALTSVSTDTIVATGSFTGSFVGNGSQLTGVVSSSYAVSASYAISASYEINYETSSSYAETASIATSASFASTASYINTAQTASYVLNAVSASYATSASQAVTASYAFSASYEINYETSSSYAETASIANTASFVVTSQTASYVLNAISASFVTNAFSATSASIATSASRAVSASYSNTSSMIQVTSKPLDVDGSFQLATTINSVSGAETVYTLPGVYVDTEAGFFYPGYTILGNLSGTATSASFATSATSASRAVSASIATSASRAVSASFAVNSLITASVSSNTITFTKGDGTTFPITVDTGSAGSTTGYVSIVNQSAVSGSVGTTETIISSVLIPANTFVSGDMPELTMYLYTKNYQSSLQVRAYINSTATIGGSMILGASSADFVNIITGISPAFEVVPIKRMLIISSSTVTLWPSITSDNYREDGNGWGNGTSSEPGFISGNITWSSSKYLVITAKWQAAPLPGDFIALRAAKLAR